LWKNQIDKFLAQRLKLELHPDKSKIISLSKGVDFVGFRNFYRHRLLRKRNIRKMRKSIEDYQKKEISKEAVLESFLGWNAYAKWANSYALRNRLKMSIINDLLNKI
jgi:hypothetical protein